MPLVMLWYKNGLKSDQLRRLAGALPGIVSALFDPEGKGAGKRVASSDVRVAVQAAGPADVNMSAVEIVIWTSGSSEHHERHAECEDFIVQEVRKHLPDGGRDLPVRVQIFPFLGVS